MSRYQATIDSLTKDIHSSSEKCALLEEEKCRLEEVLAALRSALNNVICAPYLIGICFKGTKMSP